MMGFRSSLRLTAVLLVVLTFGLVFTACRQHGPELPKGVVASTDEGGFVGNAACVECHEKEFQAHKGSRHDITLRAMNRESLQVVSPPTGTVPLAGYAVEEKD